jgi:Uncharacterized conserved protein
MTGKYIFREDIAIADLAFEVYADNLEDLFKYSGLAITNAMIVDLNSIKPAVIKEIEMENENIEFLLFNFLQEIIFYKDSERLLFNRIDVKIKEEGQKYILKALLYGEKIDMNKHELLVDVKAVTMHLFEVKKINGEWFARVIVDV